MNTNKTVWTFLLVPIIQVRCAVRLFDYLFLLNSHISCGHKV